MEESVFFLLINVIICILVGLLGKKKRIGFGWSFVFSLLLSPFIGIVIVLFSKKRKIEFVDVNKNRDSSIEEK